MSELSIRPLLIVTLLVVVMVAVFIDEATAQGVCGNRKAALEYLDRQYAERPRALGLAANNNVVELLVSEAGSWTILVTRPNGTSCVVASGEAWGDLPAVAEQPEEPPA